MARELTYKTLCESLAVKCCLSERKVDLLLKNIVLLIASELQNNSYINVKNLGKFTTEIRGGTDEWFTKEDGRMEKRYVKPFSYVNFNPSQVLLDVINGESLSKMFDKPKYKADKPTPLEDLIDENAVEQQSMNKTDYVDDIKTMIEKRKERKNTVGKNGYGHRDGLKKINEAKQLQVLCMNNNIIYPSMRVAGMELGIPSDTIRWNYLNKSNDKGVFELNGYKFKVFKKEKGQEENEV